MKGKLGVQGSSKEANRQGAEGYQWSEELRDWPLLEWPSNPVGAVGPSRATVFVLRLLILVGLVTLGIFLIWLFLPAHRGDAWLFWPLALGFIYRGLCWVVEWQYYARPRFQPFRPPSRPWKVDVFTTYCPGEPRGMVLRTLLAMKAIQYPHENYLCDEADDPFFRDACRQLGFRHVTRTVKKDAKAGNINNALAQSSGEIAVVLDPDHEPSPYLLDRTLGYFDDPKVGFVQSVQAYRNQVESMVARGAARQTYLFYGPIMIGMNAYGTTQAIGANCVFRRAALDSIGGHAAGLSEDMHTAMRLYSKGWRSKYIPEVLTRGLVPSTLAAYCKQQLKWACGTFELLFREYPKLFQGFTFWQRLHYFMAPLYYLRGVFGLVDIAVPIACLFIGGVALRIDLVSFLQVYAPLAVLVLVLRQITQKWVIEKYERGFHLIGGILATGCWWVFLQGFLCAVFRIKIPYIPTPKDNTLEDNWKLALPNLVAAVLSVAAVVYGLRMDWTPFSLLMAAFALSNAAQLLFVAMLGQQRTLARILTWLSIARGSAKPVVAFARRAKLFMLWLLREHPLIIALPVVVAAIVMHSWPKSRLPEEPGGQFKETGGFYVGADLPEADREGFGAVFDSATRQVNASFRLFPLTQRWGPDSLANFPEATMRETRLRGAVPLITWEPWTSSFPELRSDPELRHDRRVCAAITKGVFDDYLRGYAKKIRDFGDPVLIRFAPRSDDPASPWSAAGGNSPEKFVQAWIHVVSIFSEVGASNVGWVWSPSSANALERRFPGTAFVDWIDIPIKDSGINSTRQLSDLYEPYREKILEWKLPVMLSSFGSDKGGEAGANWIVDACSAIAGSFPEIRGLVLSRETISASDPAVRAALRDGLALTPLRARPAVSQQMDLWRDQTRAVSRSTAISGSRGDFALSMDGAPFYIRGVAYNPGHDWRDGNIPLTRRELDSEFKSIRAMGANTIRRYGAGWFDRNLFNAANDYNLHILYGFWFDQHVDYLADTTKLADYERRVVDSVLAWRNESSLLAWSLGNEVWGLLKHHFSQPYLTDVRHAHIDFVEKLARRIHELDPKHPVFVANEHSSQLAGALVDFATGAPSLDFVGINSYYQPRIADLRRITSEFDPGRPYLVSEFGPDGYWDTNLTPRDANGAWAEPLSDRKANDYVRGWSVFVEPNRGANIGGIAYCWRDRFEATASWFGITDSLGREKPAYLALQRLWTGEASASAPMIAAIEVPRQTLSPGETIQVGAKIDAQSVSQLQCHWELQTADFEKVPGRVRALDGGVSAQVTLPDKPGLYRLYFSVNDKGTVDVANVALLVAERAALAQNSESMQAQSHIRNK